MTVLTNRQWAMVLVCSLAFNLFAMGMLISQWWFQEQGQRPRQGVLFRLKAAVEQLPARSQQLALTIQEKHVPAIQESFSALRKTRQEVHRLLVADTLDTPRLQQAILTLDASSAEIKKRMHTLMLEVATTLPDPDRKRYFERLDGNRGKWKRE